MLRLIPAAMCRHETPAIEDERQQHVVDMAAVARDVDDFIALLRFAEAAEVEYLDAAIDPVPEPVEQNLGDADERVRIIGGDLAGVFPGQRLGLVDFDLVAPGLGGHRLAHRVDVHDAIDHGASMRTVRSDRGGSHALEMHPQHPADATQVLLFPLAGGHDFGQRDRMTELHERRPTVDERGQQAPDAAADIPVLREQDLGDRLFLVRRPADQHGYRHDPGIREPAVMNRFDQRLDHARVAPSARSPQQQAAVATIGAVAPGQVDLVVAE